MGGSVGGDGSQGCSRFCGLISRSLRPYAAALTSPPPLHGSSSSSTAEGGGGRLSFPLTKDTERELLISLSLVSREIQRWTAEVDCDSEQEEDVKMEGEGIGSEKLEVDAGSCVWHLEPPFEVLSCMANIVYLMMDFLSVESQYVQHLAGNILVVISSFLAKSGSKWEEFLHLLWISLEVSIHSCTLSSASAKTIILSKENLMLHYPVVKDETSAIAEESDPDVARFIALLQPRLMNSNGTMLTGLIEVLRKITKSLMHKHDDLVESYMHLATIFLLKVPWDLLSEVCVAQTGGMQVSSSWDDPPDGKLGSSKLNGVLSGALLQLFCSLVEKNDEEVGDHSLNELSIYSKFTNLIPNVLQFCFSNHQGYNHSHISRYLGHKALALIIRLNFRAPWQCSALFSWLQLLRKYFEDLLYQSISECHADPDISLEGSPFLASFTDGGVVVFCTLHLQRQAVYLFLKCCFTLVHLSNEPCQGCACETRTSSFTCKLQTYGTSCRAKGLSELSEWLNRHASIDKSVDYVHYLKSCSRFALSFLQLYMDEDDLLFEMLLLLFDVPFPTLQERNSKSDKCCEDMDEDTMSHISNIFNPIHLFHLFLSLIHYDHLVLLDYLISNDTGVQCLQYLLRCLRTVCKSWLVFMEFSISRAEVSRLCSMKRRKCFAEGRVANGKAAGLPGSSREESGDSSVVLKKGNRKRRKHGSMSRSTQQTFEDAKECLLSLKTLLEDLHRKNLLPYDPTPLLRIFARFQELCEQQ